MTNKQIERLIAQFIKEENYEQTLKELNKFLDVFSKEVFKLLKDGINEFSLKDGKLKNNVANLRKLKKALSKVVTNTASQALPKLMLEEYMPDIADLTKQHYTLFGDVSKKPFERALERIGIAQNPTDAIAKLGRYNVSESKFFGQIINNSGIKQTLNSIIEGGVQNAREPQQIIKALDEITNPKSKFKKITTDLKRQVEDTLSEYRGALDVEISAELGLTAAQYSGNEIEDTRPYCGGGRDEKANVTFISKINRVFHKTEIEAVNFDFQGKRNTSTYVSCIHCGDINCRHRYRFVSDQYAEYKRKGFIKHFKGVTSVTIDKATGYDINWES